VKIIYISGKYSKREIVDTCLRTIYRNELIALPTETVYGIVAKPEREVLEKLYRIKMRNERFTIHFSDISQILENLKIDEKYIEIIRKIVPGPATLIVETDNAKIGIRVPDHELVREILKTVGPAYMPSANRKDSPSPISGREVIEELSSEVSLIIDEGYTKYCMDSTVIDLTVDPPKILRSGALTIEEVEERLGRKVRIPENIFRFEPFPEKKYLKNRRSILLKDLNKINDIDIEYFSSVLLISLEKYYENCKIIENKFSNILIYGSEKDYLSMYRGVYECLRIVERYYNCPVVIVPPSLSSESIPVIERFLRAVDKVL